MANKRANKTDQKKAAVFTKEQLLSSQRYKNKRDVLNALLFDTKTYTQKEADRLIERFMKGKVK